jgi:hypothetical protein
MVVEGFPEGEQSSLVAALVRRRMLTPFVITLF